MPLQAEQSNRPETAEYKQADESGDVIRGKVNQLLNDPYFQRTMDKEALRNYQDLVSKRGYVNPDDTESLNRIYEFMAGQYKEVRDLKTRITDHVEQAVRDGVITEKDRAFYKKNMKANVVNGEQIVTKELLEQAEKDILDSLANRRKERKEYDDLMDSDLIHSGFLMVGKDKQIPVPNETAYLEMSVPERRRWLKEIRKWLPQAKEYAGKREKKEVKQLEEEYDSLLQAAKNKKIIGDKTVKKFKAWFKRQNAETKEYAVDQFFKEMNRYRILWKKIRKQLKGKSLSRLESMRDKMGYTELKNEFMKERYKAKLKQARRQKFISRHTEAAFLTDFEHQFPEGKQAYLDQFDRQMERYRLLRTAIDRLKDRNARKALNAMYENGDFGYSEIVARYERLSGQEVQSETSQQDDKEKLLGNVDNRIVRNSIEYADRTLTSSQKKRLTEKLGDWISDQNEDGFNASSFQKDVKIMRLKQAESYSKEDYADMVESEEKRLLRESSTDKRRGFLSPKKVKVSKKPKMASKTFQSRRLKPMPERKKEGKEQEKEDNEIVEEKKTQKVKSKKRKSGPKETRRQTPEGGFKEYKFSGKKKDTRIQNLYLDTPAAVRQFNNESLLDSENDKLVLKAWDGNKGIEMKLYEIRAAVKYLKKSAEEESSGKQQKEAA